VVISAYNLSLSYVSVSNPAPRSHRGVDERVARTDVVEFTPQGRIQSHRAWKMLARTAYIPEQWALFWYQPPPLALPRTFDLHIFRSHHMPNTPQSGHLQNNAGAGLIGRLDGSMITVVPATRVVAILDRSYQRPASHLRRFRSWN
jgi:hypothetical protein